MAMTKFSSLSVPLTGLLGFLLLSLGHVGLATATESNFRTGVKGGGRDLPTLTFMTSDTKDLRADRDVEGDNCTLNQATRPQCTFLFPRTKNLIIQIKCSAEYPVMWYQDAVEQLGFVRTSSRREMDLSGVTSAGDLNTPSAHAVTLYSMSLHLSYNYNQTDTEPSKFVCGAVQVRDDWVGFDPEESRTIATVVTLQNDTTTTTLLAIFRLVGPFELLARRSQRWSKLNRPKLENPNLKLEFVRSKGSTDSDEDQHQEVKVKGDGDSVQNCTVKCCLAPGAFPSASAKNIRIWLGFCTHPLSCVAGPDYRRSPTNTGHIDMDLMRVEDIEGLSEESDLELDEETRCSTWTMELFCPAQGAYHGRIFMCDVENEVKTQSPLAVSYLIDGGDRTEIEYASAWNESMGLTQIWEWTRVKPNADVATINVGDTLLVRCAPNQFTYDQTIVWELVHRNGTRTFTVSQSTFRTWYSRENLHELKVPIVGGGTEVVTVVCHSAPWASTVWVSKSVQIAAKASSPPVSILSSASPENVTFYTSERLNLRCDFTGEPPPKLAWTLEQEDEDIHVYGMRMGDMEMESYGNVKAVEIFWRGTHYQYGLDPSIHTFLPVTVICNATNPAGSATHVFNVQALRELSPVMRNSARHAVAIREGETGVLNCTLAQAVPPAEFYWTRNGENVTATSGKVTVTGSVGAGGDGSSWSALTLHNVELEDEAEYECVAVNPPGRASKEFSVRVRERIHEHAHAHTDAHADTTTTSGTGSDNWIIIVVVLTISALIPLGFLIHYLKEKNFFSRLNLSLSPSVAWARFGLNRAESTVTVNTDAGVGPGAEAP